MLTAASAWKDTRATGVSQVRLNTFVFVTGTRLSRLALNKQTNRQTKNELKNI